MVPPGTRRDRGNLPHREPAPLRGKWPNSGLVRNWAHMRAIRELDSMSKWELFVVAQESTILNLPSSWPWEMSTLSETQVPRLRLGRKQPVWEGEASCAPVLWDCTSTLCSWYVGPGASATAMATTGSPTNVCPSDGQRWDAFPLVSSTEDDGECTGFWPEDGNCFLSGCRDISAGTWFSLYIIWWSEWSLTYAFGQLVVQGILWVQFCWAKTVLRDSTASGSTNYGSKLI